MALIGGSQSGSTTGDNSPVINVQGDNSPVTLAVTMRPEDITALAAVLLAQLPISAKINGPPPAIDAALGQIASGAQAGDDRLARALQLIVDKRPAEAETLLKAVADEKAARIRQDSKDAASAYRALAAIARLTEPKRALDAYARAVEYDPNDLESALQAGWLALSRGELALAVSYFARVREKTESGRQLFWTHIGFGGALEWQGDASQAAGAYEAAIRLAQQVREQRPDSAEWRSNLRFGLTYYGDVIVRRGQTKDGLGWYLRAMALFDPKPPDPPQLNDESPSYAFLLNKIGEQWLGQGDLAGALAAHRAALAIYLALAASHPGEVGAQRALMLTHGHLGNALAADKDWPNANRSYQNAIGIAYRLVQSDPDNKEAQRDLGLMDLKVGTVLFNSNQPDVALEAYQAGLSFFQELADKGPENTEWQHDVVLAQRQVGITLAALGRPDEAAAALRESLRIATALTQRDPQNATWQESVDACTRLMAGLTAPAMRASGSMTSHAGGDDGAHGR